MQTKKFIAAFAAATVFVACSQKENIGLSNFYVENLTTRVVEVEYYSHFPDTIVRTYLLNPKDNKLIFQLYTLNSGKYNSLENPEYYDSVRIYVDYIYKFTETKKAGFLDINSFKIVEDSTKVNKNLTIYHRTLTIDDEFINSLINNNLTDKN
jgi:hypothetical protein